jgi:hypothetical protein
MSTPLTAPGRDRQLAAADLLPGSLVAQRSMVLDKKVFEGFAALTGDAHPGKQK